MQSVTGLTRCFTGLKFPEKPVYDNEHDNHPQAAATKFFSSVACDDRFEETVHVADFALIGYEIRKIRFPKPYACLLQRACFCSRSTSGLCICA